MKIRHLVIENCVIIVDPDVGQGCSQNISDSGFYAARQQVRHGHSETVSRRLGAYVEEPRVMAPVSAILMGEGEWRYCDPYDSNQDEKKEDRSQRVKFRPTFVPAFSLQSSPPFFQNKVGIS